MLKKWAVKPAESVSVYLWYFEHTDVGGLFTRNYTQQAIRDNESLQYISTERGEDYEYD